MRLPCRDRSFPAWFLSVPQWSWLAASSRDPYYRTDVWQPNGANAANIAAMVADPHDLIRGRGDSRVLAKAPEQAVEKVWAPTDAGGRQWQWQRRR